MGFQHEQSRPDRDEHVEILWNNIETDQQHNFDKYSIDVVMSKDVVQYDTKSTMHYGPYGFAIDSSLPTLVTKRAFDMQYIGQREGLSFYDIKLANLIFECTSDCTAPLPECANGGFVDKSCTCQCPSEWTGTLCDETSTAPTVVTEITETAASGEIKSTNYDAGQYPTNNALMIYIVGQPESTITVTFEAFDLEPKDGTKCWDYVQVNINDLRYGGDKYCGSTLPDQIVATASMKTITSPNYPDVYNADYTKIYNLQTSVGRQIYLMVDDIAIQTSSGYQCMEDKLIIENGKTQYRLCGDGGKVGPFVSVSNTMKVSFVTDGSIQLRGFQASFLSFESSSCGSTLDGNSGIVTSPNYPYKYANNLNCEYRIVVEQGKRVELTFDDFEIENAPRVCQYDCVEIEGAANGVLRYDGSNLPGPILSSSNELVITLKSDAYVNDDGFVARYRAV